MARPLYYIDETDQFYPRIRPLPHDPGRIGLCESLDGMEFGAAKKQLLETLRRHRDHWVVMLREIKKVTEQDVLDYEKA